jgi:hypothetical protein
MSLISDEKEKYAEIERMKKRLEDFGQKETYKEWQRNQAEIEQLKKRLALHKILMTHAADALEKWTITPDTQAFLVDALRKAAE